MRSVWCGGCVQGCVRTGVCVGTSEEGGRALGLVWWLCTGVCVLAPARRAAVRSVWCGGCVQGCVWATARLAAVRSVWCVGCVQGCV